MNDSLRAIVDRLDRRKDLQPLCPAQVWDAELEKEIEALGLPGKQGDTPIIALMAGLHLRNDSLDVSHSYAQEIEHDATGAYWHGIMHRMEGDFSNGKYWFMQAGRHPVKEQVARQVAAWLGAEVRSLLESLPQGRVRDTLQTYGRDGAWNPSTYTDLVASLERGQIGAASGEREVRTILEQIQHVEITELLRHTLEAASDKLRG